MKTRVVNIKHENKLEKGEKLVYIGRPSIFGNPYQIGNYPLAPPYSNYPFSSWIGSKPALFPLGQFPLRSWNIIVLNLSQWDILIRIKLLNFSEAFWAYCDAILVGFNSLIPYYLTRNNIPAFVGVQAFRDVKTSTTHSTQGIAAFHSTKALSPKSVVGNNPQELNRASRNTSLSLNWRLIRLTSYRLFDGEEWTGIEIFEEYLLMVPTSTPVFPHKWLSIKPPTFRITFYPDCKPEPNYNVIGVSTLRRAKNIAEEYYKKWLEPL